MHDCTKPDGRASALGIAAVVLAVLAIIATIIMMGSQDAK